MKTLTNWRYWVIAAMMTAGLLLVLCESDCGIAAFVLIKCAGFGLLWLMRRLAVRWAASGGIEPLPDDEPVNDYYE